MNLFKRLVISLFPKEITNSTINPANMFVSFISTKDFFSIINRKIVENYKTNLFDISLEPLEVQIGRDKNTKLNKNEQRDYYAYCSVANINGYKFYNISNLSCCITMATALLLQDIFKKYDEKIFTNFLYSIYLLPYIFACGIKKLPFTNRKKNYNWIVELSFNFFMTTSKKMNKKIQNQIKNELLSHPNIFFILLEFLTSQEHLILANHPQKGQKLTKRFNNRSPQGELNPQNINFSRGELSILNKVFPNDILPKYLFNDMNTFTVTKTILGEIYNKNTLINYAQKIKDNPTFFYTFIEYLTDQNLFKNGFFKGGKKYINEYFNKNPIIDDIGHEIDEIMSEIGENPENIDKFQIPERIKEESKIMEKLLNFYITLLAGFSSAKSDSFYTRIYHPNLITKIKNYITNPKDEDFFWKNYLTLYNTCTQYYEKVYEGIKNNKKKIIFHYKPNILSQLENTKEFILDNFIINNFQEINQRETKLYIKNQILMREFRNHFEQDINTIIKQKNIDLITTTYKELIILLTNGEKISKILQQELNEKDIFNIKEQVYSIDFWIRRKLLKDLAQAPLINNDSTILGITGILKETLLGIVLFIRYLEKKQYGHIGATILKIYTHRILGALQEREIIIQNKIIEFTKIYENIRNLRIHLDDNKELLDILIKNIKIVEKGSPEQPIEISNENLLRFKGVLQTISLYNKRNLIPN